MNCRSTFHRIGFAVALLVVGLAPARGQAPIFAGEGAVGPVDGKSGIELLESDASVLSSISGAMVPCAAGFAAGFPCQGIDLAAFIAKADLLVHGNLSDVWGWRDPVTGNEYGIVTQDSGTTFIDVTDAENPVLVGFLPLHAGSSASSWHDVRVYDSHAFIVADAAGAAGMQIFDLTQLTTASPPETFSETAHYPGIASAHNISVNEATGFGYIVGANGGGTTCGGGLHMLDLSTPAVPDFAGCFADATTGRSGTGYSHDVQCVVYHGPDVEHQGKEVCFGSNETHVVIADVTDKNNPSTIGKGTYPSARYIHQGWLTEDHRFFLQDDELDETGSTVANTTTYIWDVEDLDDPVMADTFMNPIGVIDHNQFVVGRYSVQSNYAAGIRVIDFGDIENASELLYFDTYPAANTKVFTGTWGNYPYLASGLILASSMHQGFFVLKPAVPLRLALDLRVFLEGPYAGSDSMSTGALFQAALPASQPYLAPEFNGTTLDYDLPEAAPLLPNNAVDWVLVELRASDTDTNPVTTEAGILLRDGRIVAAGGETLRFDGALAGSYWVVVRHRNHLAVMSSGPVDLSSGSGAWDFTDSDAKAFGSNPMKGLGGGRFGMFASDGSIDGNVTAPDFNLWNAATTAGAAGYELADFNLDGQVTAPDFNLWNANTTAGASSKVP
ncbi:MAG TPA: choice-of-anchor B family protein [Rhodothermales bacterium]|nr:choice-of-anchor B family protein [Rhodothermales bacterium]